MKIQLNQNLVLKLTFDKKPYLFNEGKLLFEENHSKTAYILFDSHQDAPTGFGVKVGKTKKTYIIQRRIDGNKVIKAKVGNVSDFGNIELARNKGRELISVAKATGKNPNVVKRLKIASEILLSEAFCDYRAHLLGRPTPAKPNSLIVFDKAVSKFDTWSGRRVKDISGQEVLKMFDNIVLKGRTTAEQTFRWANVAVNYAISLEAHNAAAEQREPTLTHNTFSILKLNKKYRNRNELEATYKANGVRKPLSLNDSMGKWLTALNNRRGHNRTGCDYLLLSTLWGTRKNEGSDLKWRHLISVIEAKTSSYVDLDNLKIYFRATKNGQDHELPITDGALKILSQRNAMNSKGSKWVFPAKSKFSKSGHYSDANSLISYVCSDAKINRIGMHDLRRSMGRIAEELTTYSMVKRVLNHASLSDPTSRYTESEWVRLMKVMQVIEANILATSPDVFKMLLTPKHSLMLVSQSQN